MPNTSGVRGGDAVEELIEAERAGIAEHMQHIEE